MKERILTGMLAGIGFLALLCWGGNLFSALLVVMALVSFYEFLRIYDFKPASPEAVLGFLIVLAYTVPWQAISGLPPVSMEKLLWLAFAAILLLPVMTKNKVNLPRASLIFTGTVYIGFGFHYMVATRALDDGLFWSLLMFVCIWATDSGAYFTGWAIGKHLLWPAISPKKTVEGALGGLALSVAAAIGFSLYAPQLLSLSHAVSLGILISLFSQFGDFVESALKRAQNVKDSGAILPGHGGVLDRVDSWLFVFPLVHAISAIGFL
ncbi:MAG TPA: phosphatidate cytidylyltransferase [Bacilli bacterium]